MEYEIDELTLEAKSLLQDSQDADGATAVYILLTDTKSAFQRVAKVLTGNPYNHVSIAFDEGLKELFSYNIYTKENGFGGGFMRETPEDLKGATYSLYKVMVDHEIKEKMKNTVYSLMDKKNTTRYNILGLVNALTNIELFKDEDTDKMICSQFVSNVFEWSGVRLFKDKTGSRVKPYDFVKSKLVTFVKRGKIKV